MAGYHLCAMLYIFMINYYLDQVDCGCTQGPDDVTKFITTLPGTTGEQIILTHSSTVLDCCGLLQSVEFYPRNTGYVQFQVWRLLTLNEYMLIAEYRYYVPTQDTSLNLTFPFEIYVESGDLLGWYTEGSGIIPYKTGVYDNNIVLSIGDVDVGYNYSLSTPFVNDRVYAIASSVDDGDEPDFTNLPASIDVYDDTPIGVTLYTVTATDDNIEDIPTLSVSVFSVSPYVPNIAFNTTTGVLTTTGLLSYGTFTINMRVADRCTNVKKRELTINVLNYPPVIGNLPASCDLSEVVTLETFLYEVTVTDASGDQVTCELNTTSPAAAPFLLKYVSGTSSYGIFSQSSPNFDFATNPLYILTILCTDGISSDAETFTVHVTQNSPPIFTNLPANVSVPLTTLLGTVVYTVRATDPEGSSVSYSIHSCGSCWFRVANSGEVIVGTSLLTKTSTTYDINIRASDGSAQSSSVTLTFIFSGLNTPPVLDNLPRTLNIPESLAIGTEVFTLVMLDPDVTDTHTYVFSYSPSSAATAFTFDTTTRRLTVATTLNYESGVTQYTISFTVDDGHLSDGPNNLIINIMDVNDAPVFQRSIYSVTEVERNTNHVLPDPGFVVTDDDPGDTVSYSITSGNSLGRFKMDPSTGILTFMVNYDIDDNNMPQFVDLIVTATDSGGMTGTALLKVTLTDSNDNSPVWEQNSYEATIASDMIVGSSIIQVRATDIDVEHANNNIIYTIYSGSTEYFGIKDNGEVYLLKSVSIYGNYTELYVNIEATSTNRDTYVELKVIVNPATNYDFFDDTGNVAWFSVCIIVGVAAVIAFSVMLYRYFRFGYVFSKSKTETSVEHLNLKNTDYTNNVLSHGNNNTTTEEPVRGVSPNQSSTTQQNGAPSTELPRYNSPLVLQDVPSATESNIP